MARILLVDDTLFMRASIRQMLEKNGHEVAGEASNGLEAITKYVETKPDLVLMDITMPEMNGIDALEQIKLQDPKAKVVMCTAMGQQSMVAQAIEKGATSFIVKPFDQDRLLKTINSICK